MTGRHEGSGVGFVGHKDLAGGCTPEGKESESE